MSLISVIIPAYNAEKTIQETIGSVLQQTFTDFEIIVVDDGSSDSTVDVVSNITDSRVKVIAGSHAGASASRNLGFVRSMGEFVAFLDADDIWTPDKLEAQLAALKNNPKAYVAYSWTNFIDEEGKFLRKGSRATCIGNVYDKILVANFLGNGSNVLIKREAIETVGGYDESLSAGQDRDLYIRLAAQYEFVVVPSPQNLYRVSQKSISSNITNSQVARLQVIEKAFENAPGSLKYLKRLSLSNHYKYHTLKALENCPTKYRSWIATKFIYKATKNDLDLLRKRVFWKVILKILVVCLLPSNKANGLMERFQRCFKLDALLAHMKIETEN